MPGCIDACKQPCIMLPYNSRADALHQLLLHCPVLWMCSAAQLVNSKTPCRHSTTSSKPLFYPHTSFNSSTAAASLLPLPPTVRLYQLVPPALAGRAAAFGSKLSLPSNWRLLDAPVFDAPGISGSTAAGISSVADRQAPPAALQASSPAAAAVADASPSMSNQAAAGGSNGSTALQQQAAARQCCVSIAVVVVEGADALQRMPELARWVLWSITDACTCLSAHLCTCMHALPVC
jgi:hypothetical protein